VTCPRCGQQMTATVGGWRCDRESPALVIAIQSGVQPARMSPLAPRGDDLSKQPKR